MTDKRKLGLYNKFNVTRTDGTDAPGGKHHGCEYFVLDIKHDAFAAAALRAYADACQKEYPALADDLRSKLGVRVPRHGACLYFMEKGIYDAEYIDKAAFDELTRKGRFADGPFRDTFGDGPGEPYNPNRQAWGITKSGTAYFTELSEAGAKS